MVNATGVLAALETPGHFEQVGRLVCTLVAQTLEFFGFSGPPVDYNVIWLDEDSAIEYDCSEHILGNIDYCVHFMSRCATCSTCTRPPGAPRWPRRSWLCCRRWWRSWG